jgi:hypothetical protein
MAQRTGWGVSTDYRMSALALQIKNFIFALLFYEAIALLHIDIDLLLLQSRGVMLEGLRESTIALSQVPIATAR